MADFGTGTPVVVPQPATPTVVARDGAVPVAVLPVAGPQGPAGSSAVYTVTAVSSWSQVHAFIYPPMVHLIDADGDLVLVGAEYPDSTHVHVSFPAPFTGTIVLS